MLNKTKKGFTIVELVIVIAVVGILAGVLIPVFVNLSNKANQASDQSLVTNLNKALRIAEADSGKKNETMHDAILDVEDYGYNLPNLVARTGEDLLWSRSEDKFYLSNDSAIDQSNKLNYWRIQDSVSNSDEYSVYAGKNFSDENAVVVATGFDVGNHKRIPSVTYSSGDTTARSAVIRTNSLDTVVTIDDAYDTVSHYDFAQKVNVTRTANNSFHEFGEVGSVTVQSGKFVAENGSKVGAVILANKDDNADADAFVYINSGADVANKYALSADLANTNNEDTNAYYFDIASDNPSTGKVISDSDVATIESEGVRDISGDLYSSMIPEIEKNAPKDAVYATIFEGDVRYYYDMKPDFVIQDKKLYLLMLSNKTYNNSNEYLALFGSDLTFDLNGKTVEFGGDGIGIIANISTGASAHLTFMDNKGNGIFRSTEQIQVFGAYFGPANVVIKNGTYEKIGGGDLVTAIQCGAGRVSLTGGTFINGTNVRTSWCASGYKLQKTGEGANRVLRVVPSATPDGQDGWADTTIAG